HKKETDGCPKSFRPSKSTLDSDEYPSFDPSKLGRFKSAQLGQLAFTFFNFMFPMAVVALLVKEYRRTTTSPSAPQHQLAMRMTSVKIDTRRRNPRMGARRGPTVASPRT
ncbi:unnamed protein product, partial [Pylaiella littoralis]